MNLSSNPLLVKEIMIQMVRRSCTLKLSFFFSFLSVVAVVNLCLIDQVFTVQYNVTSQVVGA